MERERDIQNAVMEWLSWKKIFHYRNNSGAFKTERGGFIRYGCPGSPDIVVCFNGMFIGLEVKTKNGVLSDNQKMFRENLEKAGGKYFVIRSLQDVIQAYEGKFSY